MSNGNGFNVSAEDIRRYDWQARLAVCERKEIHSFYTALTLGAKDCETAGDDLGLRVYSLLLCVASFHANFDAKGNPYGPMWTNPDGSHSLTAEEMADSDLSALGAIVEEIADPEFRARVADVLWSTKRIYKAAQIAVSAFLESASRLKSEDLWPPFTERLERAARISAIRGFENEESVVVAALEAAVVEFENNEKSGLLCHRLMSILLSLGNGDRIRYAALAERLANHFAGVGNWHFSEDYWQLAEQWHRRAKNDSEIQRCQLAAAECNISRAEAGLATHGAGYAAHWTGRGVEALRRAKADPARIAIAHRRFLELEQLSLADMGTIEIPVDEMPGFRDAEKQTQEAAAKHVLGLDFQAAIGRFANVARPTVLAELETQYAKASEHSIFDKIIGTTAIDHKGKVADIIPPSGFGTQEEEATALRKKLTQQAAMINWPMQVTWKIEPARIALVGEHAMRRGDLQSLVLNNPFVPEGHEGIYLRGLQAGFFGDWLAAMNMLLPQVEASIRHVLKNIGVITTTLDSDHTQSEKDLNQLLWLPEVETMFGSDIVFDLRGILIERFGHNLRNDTAHGLLPEAAFYQPASVYAWWLILHLCWKGFRIAQKDLGNA